MVTKKKKDLDYYLSLPWSYSITPTKANGKRFYIIRVSELPGICSDAPTINEAFENIEEAMATIFQMYLEKGEKIPEPVDQEAYKGKIAYRTTSKRHSTIAKAALTKRVSLSEIIDECVDRILR